jgi:hypothetical protein
VLVDRGKWIVGVVEDLQVDTGSRTEAGTDLRMEDGEDAGVGKDS